MQFQEFVKENSSTIMDSDAQAFINKAEEIGVSLDHKDDWELWWEMFQAGMACAREEYDEGDEDEYDYGYDDDDDGDTFDDEDDWEEE